MPTQEYSRIDTPGRNAMPRIPVSLPPHALLQSALALLKRPLALFTLTAKLDCIALLEPALMSQTAPILLASALPKSKQELIALMTGCALTAKDVSMASALTGTHNL
jgi:hypothetical protein